MSTAKPETRFSARFHRRLDPLRVAYYEKTSNRWRAGVPDFYYEGHLDQTAWAEHKYLDRVSLGESPIPSLELKFSGSGWPKQRAWLLRAARNGLASFLIIGMRTGCYVLRPPFNYVPSLHPLLSLEEGAAILCSEFTSAPNLQGPTAEPGH